MPPMPPIRLYTGPLSMFGAKAEIALLEKGLAFERIAVPFDKDDRYAPKHPEVLRVNPKGQVPVLVHGGGGGFRFHPDFRVSGGCVA